MYCVALALSVIVFKIYNIPMYTAKDNLAGVILLMFMLGFATIPMVHVCEKLFNDAGVANMYILCMNVILGLASRISILLFDVLCESEVRSFVHRNKLK